MNVVDDPKGGRSTQRHEMSHEELERLYPGCTRFLTWHPRYPEGLLEGIRCGVVFIHAEWSGPAVMRFKAACAALDGRVPWDRFTFHVVDTDGLSDGGPFRAHEVLGGYGEAFWVLAGKVVRSVGRDCGADDFRRYTAELLEAIYRELSRLVRGRMLRPSIGRRLFSFWAGR